MSDDKLDKLKEKKEELEHEVFEQKLKGVRGQIIAIGDTVHQRITDLEDRNEIEFSYIKKGIDEIKQTTKDTLATTKKTNGRVTELEKENIKLELRAGTVEKDVDDIARNTRIIRFMHKYPKVTGMLVIIGYLFTIKEIRDLFFNSISGLWKLIF